MPVIVEGFWGELHRYMAFMCCLIMDRSGVIVTYILHILILRCQGTLKRARTHIFQLGNISTKI